MFTKKLKLPRNTENLFVLKPIGNFEALSNGENKNKFLSDPN